VPHPRAITELCSDYDQRLLFSAVQYVVDASEDGYWAEALVDLAELLAHPDMASKPVQIVATKWCVPGNPPNLHGLARLKPMHLATAPAPEADS